MQIEYQENTLTADAFLAFQRQMGWPIYPRAQVEKSITNQLYAITVVDNGIVVGFGRLNGDAALYWYVNDVFILPEYQGKGIGTQIMQRLIDYAVNNSLPGTNISLCLMSAQGKEGFYEKLGFQRRPSENEGAGMELEIDIP